MLKRRCGNRRGSSHDSIDGCVSLWGDRSFSSLLLFLFYPQPRRVHVTLVCIARRREWWLYNARRSIVGQPQFDKTVEIVQDLWVSEHRCTPVSINASLQFRMRLGNLGLQSRDIHGVYWWVARETHVDFVVGQGREVGSMSLFACGCKALEGSKDMLASMVDHPISVASSVYRRDDGVEQRTESQPFSPPLPAARPA